MVAMAATRGKLDDLLIEDEQFIEVRNDGITVIHITAMYGHLEQIPAHLLTANNLLRQCIDGSTVLHYAAANGQLHLIRKDILSTENLSIRGQLKRTPFHWAARNGHLCQLPNELLSADNLLVKDRSHKTPLYLAARSGFLEQIPRNILTTENLLRKANNGMSALEEAAHGRKANLNQLLGLNFENNEEVRAIVGEEWFKENNILLKTYLPTTKIQDIDIF